jgi:hypothetical protein
VSTARNLAAAGLLLAAAIATAVYVLSTAHAPDHVRGVSERAGVPERVLDCRVDQNASPAPHARPLLSSSPSPLQRFPMIECHQPSDDPYPGR